tara:strand:+ start:270 stop:857 length:588 start_codon:yes stop_codon:yes gene_type:complete
MIEIDDKLISDDLFSKQFVCDLQKCKGVCCVEGDAGAPLTKKEVENIEKNLDVIKPEMRKEGLKAIEDNGVFYLDDDGEKVTTLVNGKECAFVFFDDNNIAKCSIESAYLKNKLEFRKPISCHLYPIRVKKYNDFQAINIDNWHICKPACECGTKLNVPTFKFLKQAIVRMWGDEFYQDLEIINNKYFKKDSKDL